MKKNIKYFITTPKQYRSSTFHGYFRPVVGNPDGGNNVTNSNNVEEIPSAPVEDNSLYNGDVLPTLSVEETKVNNITPLIPKEVKTVNN